MITRCTFVAGQAGLIATLAAGGATAFAQTITQSARLVVGFPAGGAADTIARLLAEQMKDFAPKLIVDNKAGAGGRIALESMKTSAADGSALILTPASMVVLFPHVYKKLAYDPLKDLRLSQRCAPRRLRLWSAPRWMSASSPLRILS